VSEGGSGLALLCPAREQSVSALGRYGYPRASVLILGKAVRGRVGHQTHACDGETVFPSPQSNSQVVSLRVLRRSTTRGIFVKDIGLVIAYWLDQSHYGGMYGRAIADMLHHIAVSF
jgi:hypothetical protein